MFIVAGIVIANYYGLYYLYNFIEYKNNGTNTMLDLIESIGVGNFNYKAIAQIRFKFWQILPK